MAIKQIIASVFLLHGVEKESEMSQRHKTQTSHMIAFVLSSVGTLWGDYM